MFNEEILENMSSLIKLQSKIMSSATANYNCFIQCVLEKRSLKNEEIGRMVQDNIEIWHETMNAMCSVGKVFKYK
jgi:hypothetical protein